MKILPMRLRRVDPPPEGQTAEGRCNGLPFYTDLVNINGVMIHFWTGAGVTDEVLQTALSHARNARDIVYATWSLGEPSGFWNHAQDIVPGQ